MKPIHVSLTRSGAIKSGIKAHWNLWVRVNLWPFAGRGFYVKASTMALVFPSSGPNKDPKIVRIPWRFKTTRLDGRPA